MQENYRMESSYERIEKNYTVEEKRDFWEIAIGLNKVDNLEQSSFVEGNTRTIALFIEKYLKSLAFSFLTDIFKDNSLYFRNALVIANAPNQKDITFEYIEGFFEKCLFENEKTLDEIQAISQAR